ncbi:MAG: KAP family P-loop NTPase fold protein [Flavobacterium sp.]|uniref:KAP family P-loop NTPase fold protein n=1 Tax=Flavobacterium sp. TaxID=239 RepID=UPI003BD0896F
MQIRSCITDKPIENNSDDKLKMSRYGNVLSNFIKASDTPLTVGLQGEWGTGKTSMLYMLLEHFKSENIATSWVNTWEYSMFRSSGETTPAILKGMLTNLKLSCESEGKWTIEEKSKDSVKKVFKFLGNVANQVISNQTGVDIKDAASNNEASREQAEIAEIKKEIALIITKLIEDTANEYQKVVFLVDDLDRIPPEQAVEVLESLKNLFDVPHCVFVLAIDYDVVVKGLESKFGKKTEENEREFRSFFDKIIQVPFSMPTGTYDMGNLLSEKLISLNIEIPEDLIDSYSNVVKYTIGYNPRSLKRYINSFSLLRSLRNSDFEEDASDFGDNAPDSEDDLILFAMIGVQISYPKIFRLITQMSDIYDWDKGFANKNNIDLEAVKTDIQKYGDNDKLNEDWEQIIYGACQNDVYLKSKVFNILELFNYLRDKFENRPDVLDEKIVMALKFASITNVDDDVNIKGVVEKRGNKTVFSDIKTKIDTIRKELIENGAKKEGIEIKLKTYQNLFDTCLAISNEMGLKFEIMSSSVRFDFGYLQNPPKQTELVGLELMRLKDYSNLPKGLISVGVKDEKKQKVAFKVSKELNYTEFKAFLKSNYM